VTLYRVRFRSVDLWPGYAEDARDVVEIELYEHWLDRNDPPSPTLPLDQGEDRNDPPSPALPLNQGEGAKAPGASA
jgi:Nitrile hydratase beta subunit